MQALKLKQQRGIDAYTDNLAMKIVVSTLRGTSDPQEQTRWPVSWCGGQQPPWGR